MEKAVKEGMELGNLLFGHARGRFRIPRDEAYEGTFLNFLKKNGFDSYGFPKDGEGFENGTFSLFPYYWGDDEELAARPNFTHKPTGLEVRWYKYPLRDAYADRDVGPKEWKAILDECARSMHSG